MDDPRQFSLRFLMAEVTLICVAIGSTLACIRLPVTAHADALQVALALPLLVSWLAAIAGAFGNMKAGAVAGACLWGIWLLWVETVVN
jgi:hypothetical protein